MRGLSGRRAILTGGASGIGRATTVRLAEEGVDVAIFDLDLVGAEETAQLAASAPGSVKPFKVDITNYDMIVDAVSRFESAVGPTELLANVAGWDKIVPFMDTERDLWDKVVAINLYGPLNMHHIVVRSMAERGFGRVVNVSSDAGRVGSSGEAVYSACKGGIAAFTKTLARELARKGVVLNVLCPGPTDTPLFASVAEDSEAGQRIAEGLKRAIPLRRLGQPEDYPGLITFLLSDDARFITGQTVSVSGGLTMHG